MIDISTIQTDSRKIKPGDTFIAIKGINSDGHDYINAAIENGAAKIIATDKKDINFSNFEIVTDTSKYLNDLLLTNYLPLFKEMKFIGITGTNGKTTSCYLIYQMLNILNSKTAYIGTIGYYDGDKVIELNNTTPDILELYKLIYLAYQNNCQNVVMEVSSHALDQNRINGLQFSFAGFTNLTQDHLDYHLTFTNYLNAKLKILNYLKNDGSIIVNLDDKYAESFLNSRSITLGYQTANYQIIKFEEKTVQTHITFNHNNNPYEVNVNLIGEFNVYNYLLALAVVNTLGYSVKDIIKISDQIFAPKGRAEAIKIKSGVVVIDYAHTPDAVEKIIKTFNTNKNNRLITIIGCGGNRDKTKRPIIGNIATELSDYVIFTSDNPRNEEPMEIINNIISNIKKNNYQVIVDRREAISKTIEMMEPNDIILLLGKGHETYQEINGKKYHFDDKEEVLKTTKN